MKYLSIIMAIVLLSMIASAQEKTATINLKGKSAEGLALALLTSGFQAEVKNGVRTLKDAKLVLVQGIGNHECDDEENVMCGFSLPATIESASQNGKAFDASESGQLVDVIERVVQRKLEILGIDNSDSGIGKAHSDYGTINCSWSLSKRYEIQNAICTLIVPNYGIR